MTISNKDINLTMDVSEQEISAAKQVKSDFASLLGELQDALDLIFNFKEALTKQRPSLQDLTNYRGKFLRFRRKVTTVFNQVLLALQAAAQSMHKIMDPEMDQLLNIIMAEFDELSDTVENFLKLLAEPAKEGFTQEVEKIALYLEQRFNSIDDIIDNQLFSHLSKDIMGRLKVSSLEHRIRVRRRKILKIARSAYVR